MQEIEQEDALKARSNSSGALVADRTAELASMAGEASKRSRRRWWLVGVVVLISAAAAWYWVGSNQETAAETEEVALTTTAIQVRDLAEFEELDGSLEFAEGLTFNSSVAGSLTFLAEDGVIVERGDVIAVVSDELSELEVAQISQTLESAESQVASSNNNLANLLEAPSQADIVSAEVAVQAAQTGLDDILEPPSDAELTRAALAVTDARAELNDARDGVEAEDLVGLQQQVEQASASVSSAQNNVETSLVSAITAQSAYCLLPSVPVSVCGSDDLPLNASEVSDLTDAISDFLDAADNPSAQTTQSFISASVAYENALTSLDTAELNLDVALDNLTDAEEGVSQSELDRLQLSLTEAAEAYDELVAGASSTRIAQAESDLLSAQARLADLLAGASTTSRNSAYSALESARASLEVQQISASEQLATGPTYTVLMYGTAPAWRDLSADSTVGPDVEQLEANLLALGFDADGTLTVDNVYDNATASAVSDWQESLGLEATGEVPLGSVVFVEGPSLVDGQLGTLGANVNFGSPLLSLTPTRSGEDLITTQRVVAQLPLADRSLLDIGTEVVIDLPDGTDVPATVLDIGNVPLGGGADGSEAYVEVEIRPIEPIDEVWIGADVDVEVVSELAADVLSVPVSALLALVEGGYAVEIEEGSGTRLVGVETGMFADGFVEISGSGLEAGMDVVVPR